MVTPVAAAARPRARAERHETDAHLARSPIAVRVRHVQISCVDNPDRCRLEIFSPATGQGKGRSRKEYLTPPSHADRSSSSSSRALSRSLSLSVLIVKVTLVTRRRRRRLRHVAHSHAVCADEVGLARRDARRRSHEHAAPIHISKAGEINLRAMARLLGATGQVHSTGAAGQRPARIGRCAAPRGTRRPWRAVRRRATLRGEQRRHSARLHDCARRPHVACAPSTLLALLPRFVDSNRSAASLILKDEAKHVRLPLSP